MNLGQIKAYLESISTMDNKDFTDAVYKIGAKFIGCGMYRESWLIGGSLVIKRETWGDEYSEYAQWYPFANLCEYEFYRRAPNNLKRFVSPCMWISWNGKVAIYRYEKAVELRWRRYTPYQIRDMIDTLLRENKTLQEIVRHFTGEVISDSNCVLTSNGKRLIIMDYAENNIATDSHSRFAETYDAMVEWISVCVETTVNTITGKIQS